MPIRGIAVDLETGSLDARTGAVTSIAAVAFRIEDSGYVSPVWGEDSNCDPRFHLSVEPHEETMVSLKSLKVQGLTWETFASRGVVFSEESVYRAFMGFLTAHGYIDHTWHKHIWAWNAPFDYAFLREMASRVPGTAGVFPFRPCWNDAKGLFEVAVNTGLLPEVRDTSLKTVAASFGIEHTPHEALSDALATVEVLARTWKALRNPS